MERDSQRKEQGHINTVSYPKDSFLRGEKRMKSFFPERKESNVYHHIHLVIKFINHLARVQSLLTLDKPDLKWGQTQQLLSHEI